MTNFIPSNTNLLLEDIRLFCFEFFVNIVNFCENLILKTQILFPENHLVFFAIIQLWLIITLLEKFLSNKSLLSKLLACQTSQYAKERKLYFLLKPLLFAWEKWFIKTEKQKKWKKYLNNSVNFFGLTGLIGLILLFYNTFRVIISVIQLFLNFFLEKSLVLLKMFNNFFCTILKTITNSFKKVFNLKRDINKKEFFVFLGKVTNRLRYSTAGVFTSRTNPDASDIYGYIDFDANGSANCYKLITDAPIKWKTSTKYRIEKPSANTCTPSADFYAKGFIRLDRKGNRLFHFSDPITNRSECYQFIRGSFVMDDSSESLLFIKNESKISVTEWVHSLHLPVSWPMFYFLEPILKNQISLEEIIAEIKKTKNSSFRLASILQLRHIFFKKYVFHMQDAIFCWKENIKNSKIYRRLKNNISINLATQIWVSIVYAVHMRFFIWNIAFLDSDVDNLPLPPDFLPEPAKDNFSYNADMSTRLRGGSNKPSSFFGVMKAKAAIEMFNAKLRDICHPNVESFNISQSLFDKSCFKDTFIEQWKSPDWQNLFRENYSNVTQDRSIQSRSLFNSNKTLNGLNNLLKGIKRGGAETNKFKDDSNTASKNLKDELKRINEEVFAEMGGVKGLIKLYLAIFGWLVSRMPLANAIQDVKEAGSRHKDLGSKIKGGGGYNIPKNAKYKKMSVPHFLTEVLTDGVQTVNDDGRLALPPTPKEVFDIYKKENLLEGSVFSEAYWDFREGELSNWQKDGFDNLVDIIEDHPIKRRSKKLTQYQQNFIGEIRKQKKLRQKGYLVPPLIESKRDLMKRVIGQSLINIPLDIVIYLIQYGLCTAVQSTFILGVIYFLKVLWKYIFGNRFCTLSSNGSAPGLRDHPNPIMYDPPQLGFNPEREKLTQIINELGWTPGSIDQFEGSPNGNGNGNGLDAIDFNSISLANSFNIESIDNVKDQILNGINNYFDSLQNSGISFQQLDNLILLIMLSRFIYLIFKYNILTAALITGICSMTGYMWYAKVMRTLFSYEHVFYLSPYTSTLSVDSYQIRTILQEKVKTFDFLTSTPSGFLGYAYNYACVKNGYRIDPISMIVSILPPGAREDGLELYYRATLQFIPIVLSLWLWIEEQLRGMAGYTFITRVNKKFTPYLIRWHWSLMLYVDLFDRQYLLIIVRTLNYMIEILDPQLLQTNLPYLTEKYLNLEMQLLVYLLLIMSVFHMAILMYFMLHAFWGQYLYIPFLTENVELHIGERKRNSIYGCGNTPWQPLTPENKNYGRSYPSLIGIILIIIRKLIRKLFFDPIYNIIKKIIKFFFGGD